MHYSLPSSSSSSEKKKQDNDNNNKDKLLHQGFRIQEQVIKNLAEEAARKGISVSNLVNKILRNYVTHEMQFEELGFILVSKDFLRKIFNVVDDEKDIQDFGKEFGTTMAKEYVSYFYPQVNSITLVQFLDYWFRRFQSSKHIVENSDRSQRHYFTVNHDINIKFSFALKAILEGLIEPVSKTTVEFRDVTANSITFSFEVV
ncbi:MAG TPA: hypothetical protein VFY68_13975 [Nitrososphaeraceae archaeon]|nr:hypothetical protein [Nitrososphaeraceae archaeon]